MRSPKRLNSRVLPASSKTLWNVQRNCSTPWSIRFRPKASYAVSLAYKLRFVIDLNARQAMHMLELRTSPQGHPAYRVVCQDMHRLIAEEAGHHAIAEMMHFVDHSEEQPLERLDAERRAEAKRSGLSG